MHSSFSHAGEYKTNDNRVGGKPGKTDYVYVGVYTVSQQMLPVQTLVYFIRILLDRPTHS